MFDEAIKALQQLVKFTTELKDMLHKLHLSLEEMNETLKEIKRRTHG